MFIAVWKLSFVIGVVGQVPQTGLLLSDNDEPELKPAGSELKFVTHQLDISWSKESASLNIFSILVTLTTCQELKSLLKELAPWNIPPIFVTLLTSHAPMSALKVVLFSNALLMSVTLLTSQLGIAPYSL